MTVGAADLHKAINTLWDEHNLDDFFTALWADGDDEVYPVLHDGEATPGQPFPYCVMEVSQGSTVARMVRDTVSKWEIRDVPCQFRIHATENGERSAKQVASDLAAEVMKIYGGHPTVAPQTGELDNGNYLIAQHQADYGIRTGDSEYQWTVSYLFRLDVPVTVLA